MEGNGPALVALKNGYLYAAVEHRFADGWLHIQGARFWKTGPEGQERARFGRSGTFSWPREAVREVSPVRDEGEGQEASDAPVVA
jgi:hypothetical protein